MFLILSQMVTWCLPSQLKHFAFDGQFVKIRPHKTLAISSQYCSPSFRFSDGHAVNGFVILLAKSTLLSKFLTACIKGRGRMGLFASCSVLFKPWVYSVYWHHVLN